MLHSYFLYLIISLDQSDMDLRHSIANMIAVVMELPSRSNHLWYHMFAADELVNTYMTGFMVQFYIIAREMDHCVEM